MTMEMDVMHSGQQVRKHNVSVVIRRRDKLADMDWELVLAGPTEGQTRFWLEANFLIFAMANGIWLSLSRSDNLVVA